MSQPTIPVCYRHPSRETYLRCSRCDRPICPSCMNDAAVGHHCPDCVAEGRRSQRSARTAFGGTQAGRHGHVTIALIALNVAVAAMVLVIGGTQSAAAGGWGGLLGGLTPAHLWGGLQPGPQIWTEIVGDRLLRGTGGVAEGEYYRLLTSMFLHYGVFHLALNMFALWVVGGVLEPLLGRLRFLALYLVSGIGGGVATYLFASMGTVAAGASGAVFGLFAAFFIIMRRLGRDTSMITMILVVNLILTFVIPQISIWGHLGGLVTGGLVALGLAYAPRQHRNPIQLATIVGIVVVLTALTITRTLLLT
ncbi:rhomboid family intramembrane serine protease [Natronosporangium hydrolyticum]|uniref:Rhomboid family intramembrane serine protease n=1 Tax=Natronosporangium hydrolyticum TaxID=2811111 RepID=A0A895YJJ0_9ACTN|nr:rhomboid family intramembrane serine protease [Natronosporangium hydrolyticum]QSB14776.1 rhomboid family intramembrane serine protease [Natronosporangium hydrolyticum]